MLTFLIVLLPLSLFTYVVSTKDKNSIFPCLLGFAMGILTCIFKLVFTYAHRVVVYSVVDNFLFYFFNQSFLPIVLVFAAFSIISKDNRDFKVKYFFPVLVTFYSIYLPYSVISMADSIYTPYELFIKPILYLSMLIQYSWCVKGFYKSSLKEVNRIKKTIFYTIIMLSYSVFIALSESLYLMNISYMINMCLCLFFVFFAFCVLCGISISRKKSMQENE